LTNQQWMTMKEKTTRDGHKSAAAALQTTTSSSSSSSSNPRAFAAPSMQETCSTYGHRGREDNYTSLLPSVGQ